MLSDGPVCVCCYGFHVLQIKIPVFQSGSAPMKKWEIPGSDNFPRKSINRFWGQYRIEIEQKYVPAGLHLGPAYSKRIIQKRK